MNNNLNPLLPFRMKLQKLTIHNLTSIEDAVIDFEQEPLSGEAIFLICGETGSGKTTILDAICLALYNDTPRMSQSANENYRDTNHTFSKSKDSVAINDKRQLMRRNTGEAWVELDFIGTNEIPYTARWYVSCARKKANATIQDVKWTWENRRTQTTYSKRLEINTEQATAIGLTFEQFCRTTLLAQGDFTKFLQSQSKEKSEILEKLTGTEIYSALGEKIYVLTQEKKQQYEQQVQKLEGIQLLTPEAEENLRLRIRQQQETATACKKQLENIRQQVEWLKKEAELQETYTRHETAWKNQQEILSSEAFTATDRFISEWNASTEARECIRQLKELQDQQQQAGQKEASLLQQRQKLKAGDAWLAEHRQELQNQLEQRQQILQQEAPFVPMYENSQSLLTQLQTATNARLKQIEKTKELSVIEKEIQELAVSIQKGNTFVKEQEQLLSAKQLEIDTLQTELGALKPAETQTALQQNEQKRENCSQAIAALTLLLEQRKKETEERENLTNLHQQLETYTSRHQALQQTYDQLSQQQAEAEALYNKQKESVEDWASEARLHLHAGDHCPVCGQLIAELPSDSHFQSLLQPVYENWQQKKKACEQAEKAVHENQTNIRLYQEQCDKKQKAVKQAVSSYQEQLRLTVRLCTAYPFDQLTHHELELLQEIAQSFEKERNDLRTKVQAIQQLEQRQKEKQVEKDKLQKRLDDANRKLKAIESRQADTKVKEESVRSFLASQKQLVEEAREQLRAGMLWEDWEKQWNEDARMLMQRLQNASNAYRQISDETNKLQNETEKEDQLEKSLCPLRVSVTEAYPMWKETGAVAPLQVNDLHEAWLRFVTDCQRLKALQDSLQATISRQETLLMQFLDSHPDFTREHLQELSACSAGKIEELRTDQQQVREKAVSLQAALQQTAAQREQHQQERPVLEADDTVETLTEKQRLLEAQSTVAYQEIGQLENQLTTNAENHARLKDEQALADRLQEIYRQWERLNYHFGDAKGTKFRNIAQSFVLKELLTGANAYLRRLTDRYELSCQAGSLTILLRDFYQGGSARPASTLSGGESFLVSLSLALGLSSLNQHRLSTDMLFIDEGFGTLSEDYLNTVMDTLERLHQLGGKKVGIISHVEGLRERIKTQIQVNRIDNSRSEIQVVRAL